MLIILPRRCGTMNFPTACEKRNVPVRFVSMTLFQCCNFISSTGAPQAVPALLMRMSIRPNCERSEEHTSELQSQSNLVCRLLLEKKNNDSEIVHLDTENSVTVI